MAERIHIAGFSVGVDSLLRQRCAWCGEVLIDLDLANIAVAPGEDGAPGRGPGTWEPFALVAVDGPCSWVVPCAEGEPLPLRCCASQRKLTLVEGEAEVTNA